MKSPENNIPWGQRRPPWSSHHENLKPCGKVTKVFYGSDNKASAYNAGDPGSIPGMGRSPGEGNGNPLHYSCLENPMDGGAWWAAVHGVAKSRTRLRSFNFTFHFSLSCIGEGNGSPLQCSCLENPRDGGAWWAAVSGVTQSRTQLKWLSIA